MADSKLEKQFKELAKYTACDISDALLNLHVPGAGFLGDLVPRTPTVLASPLVAPASTVLFLPNSLTPSPLYPTNIPTSHFADSLFLYPSTILIISQPSNHYNAVLGGLVALRLSKVNIKGILIDGRVRDLPELAHIDLPILSTGVSTVGAGALSKAHRVNGEEGIKIHGTEAVVRPGDVVYVSARAEEGCVAVPRELLGRVLEMLPRLVEQDELVRGDVENGLELGGSMKLRREIG